MASIPTLSEIQNRPQSGSRSSGSGSTVLGVDPVAAIRKLLGDSSADVIPGWDGGGRIQPRLFDAGVGNVVRGGTERNRASSGSGSSGDDVIIPGVPSFSNWRPDATGPTEQQLAAQAEARRLAAIEAQADPLRQALSALDSTLRNQLRGVDSRYDEIMKEYQDMAAQDRDRYDRNVSTNEQQLMGNRQNSLLSGARLGQNLNSVLASMGALRGTGQHLAGEAVQGITNRSLGDHKETFTTNATNINDAWSEAERAQRQREEEARRIREDQRANVRAENLTSRQKILNQLGNLYGADNARGAEYLGQAGALYGQIANTTRPNVAEYQRASSTYSPGALESYLSGIGNTQVTSEGGNQTDGRPINSPLFARNERRRDERLV